MLKKADLDGEENLSISREGKEEIDAANLSDEGKIRVIQTRIRTRETGRGSSRSSG